MHVPRDSRSLLHILKRVYRGNEEFADADPDLARSTTARTKRDLVQLAKNPRQTVDAIVFGGFAVTARVVLRFARKPVRWERDDSSRV